MFFLLFKGISSESRNYVYLDSSQPETVSSVASGYNVIQLEALNSFLLIAKMSPVKELQESNLTCSRSTQYRYIEKAKACVDLLFDTMCPNEWDFLKANALKASEHEDVLLSTLVEIYNRAETWKLQRLILSIIAKENTLEDIQKVSPCLILF